MARWQGFYDELAERRYPALLAYAIAVTGQRATAEDLVQEAMVRTSSSFTPNDIPIDGLRGYPDVSLALENCIECPAPTEGRWSQRSIDPSTVSSTLVIQGDFTIDWTDGSTAVTHQTTLFLTSAP